MFNIIKLNANDNIAVAPMNIPSGSEINSTLKAQTNIPFGHKISLEDIKKGDLIYKYGQIIGIAFEEIKKELGDLLLHIVFYSRIASEKNKFDISDVLNTISDKLIHRHPHIYGNVKVKDEKDVKENWEKLKLKEGKNSVLVGVPKSLPAVVKAYRIQEKVRGIGFDWQNKEQVWDKVLEEIQELKDEEINKSERIEDEFGDLLFALINYPRFININPEDALEKTNKRFIKRFQILESMVKNQEKEFSDLSFEEMNFL